MNTEKLAILTLAFLTCLGMMTRCAINQSQSYTCEKSADVNACMKIIKE
jgi:hypothetical protein